jgi:hypothetical protein
MGGVELSSKRSAALVADKRFHRPIPRTALTVDGMARRMEREQSSLYIVSPNTRLILTEATPMVPTEGGRLISNSGADVEKPRRTPDRQGSVPPASPF